MISLYSNFYDRSLSPSQAQNVKKTFFLLKAGNQTTSFAVEDQSNLTGEEESFQNKSSQLDAKLSNELDKFNKLKEMKQVK